MTEAIKIYQSNNLNLLMQLDTKHDKPYLEGFHLQYHIGKEGNELYIYAKEPKEYTGALTMQDFAFSGTTHRLLVYIRELHTLRGTDRIDFSVKDYMLRCDLKDRKQARKQLERDLFSLLAIVYSSNSGRSAILDAYELHHGRAYIQLNQGFTAETSKQDYILLPKVYFTLDRQKYNYAPGLLYYMTMLRYLNSKKSNKNRISIRSLLAYGKFPTIEAVRATKNNSIKGRIVEPFFRNLNALSGVARFTFYNEYGDKLTQAEVQKLNYDDMVRIIVHIDWL